MRRHLPERDHHLVLHVVRKRDGAVPDVFTRLTVRVFQVNEYKDLADEGVPLAFLGLHFAEDAGGPKFPEKQSNRLRGDGERRLLHSRGGRLLRGDGGRRFSSDSAGDFRWHVQYFLPGWNATRLIARTLRVHPCPPRIALAGKLSYQPAFLPVTGRWSRHSAAKYSHAQTTLRFSDNHRRAARPVLTTLVNPLGTLALNTA